MLLANFYLGPIQYFSKFLLGTKVQIEACENFPKQTYRNRCVMQTSNGQITLSIPVLHGSQLHSKYTDIKISYAEDWQRHHWRSMTTAYRNSPFFEYYEDELAPFYTHKYEYLFEYNLALTQLFLKQLKIDADFKLTEVYEKFPSGPDFRTSISPKVKN